MESVTKQKGNAMTKPWLSRLILAGLCLAPLSAVADPNGPSWLPEFGTETGFTAGGDNLVDPQVTGQPALTPSNVTLNAGNGLYAQGYYRQALGRSGLSFKLAAGLSLTCELIFCFDSAMTGPYSMSSVTGDAAVEYAWDGGRLGLGRTLRALNLLTSTSSVYAFDDVYLKPAYGWFLEYEVDHLGLRYTHIVYRSSTSGLTLNGSNVSLYLHANYRDEDWYPGGRYFNQGMGYARQELTLALHPGEWSF